MKIAFFLATILEQGGGTQEFYIKTSVEINKRFNHEVDIICLDDKYTVQVLRIILSVFYFKWVPKSLFYNEDLTSIKKRLGKVRYIKCKSFKHLKETLSEYDLVYSKNELLETMILKLLVGFENISKVILSCHTALKYTSTDTIQDKIRNKLYGSWVYKYLCKDVKAFHVLNSTDGDFLKDSFPTKTLYQIYPPFDFDIFKGHAEEYIFDHQFDSEKYNILSVGRISKQKGVDELVKLINEINLTPLKDKVVWNIFGGGEESYQIEQLAIQWDNVNFFGYVENKYLANILQSIDIHISLSKMETFGYTIVEASTMNVPSITYRLPGPTELLENEKNGLIAENYENFKDLLRECIVGKHKFEGCEEFMRTKLSSTTIYTKMAEMFEDVQHNSALTKKMGNVAIFAIIGGDGVGKTTTAKLLTQRLQELGYYTHFDKRFEEYFIIKPLLNLLKKGSKRMAQNLYFDRAKKTPPIVQVLSPWAVLADQLLLYLYTKFIGPKRIVITDRYPYGFLVTWRYYGLSNALIDKLYLAFPRPTALYILRSEPEKAMIRKRNQVQSASSRYSLEYFSDHVDEYDKIANILKINVIDSNQEPEKVVEVILNDIVQHEYLS